VTLRAVDGDEPCLTPSLCRGLPPRARPRSPRLMGSENGAAMASRGLPSRTPVLSSL